MKRKILLLIVPFASVVLMLYLFEGILRVTQGSSASAAPPAGSLRFDARGADAQSTLGHPVVSNRLGFRDREFATPKPAGTYRVMVLGDSLTWGVGLDARERYTNLLERALQADHPGRRIEVLNFGFPGRSTVQERDTLKYYVGSIDPDLIVVGFCYNDPYTDTAMNEDRRRAMLAENHGVLRALRPLQTIGLRYTYDAISKAVVNSNERLSGVSMWEVGVQESYQTDSPEWQSFYQALKDIKSVSDAHHLPAPVFAVLDSATYTDKPTDYSHPDKALSRRLEWYHAGETAAKAAGFQTLNYEPELAAEFSDKITAVSSIDAHPNAALNRLYARKLLKTIERNFPQ